MAKHSNLIFRLFHRKPPVDCADRCVKGIYWRFEWQNGKCVAVEAMRPCQPGDEGYVEADVHIAALDKPDNATGDKT